MNDIFLNIVTYAQEYLKLRIRDTDGNVRLMYEKELKAVNQYMKEYLKIEKGSEH